MNTQSAKQADPQQDVELRLRTMRILWFGLLMSVVIYFGFTQFVGRPEGLEPNQTLSLALLAAAVSTTLISFFIKSKLVSKAVEQQHIGMVQQAYVTTWAITEVPALLGMVDFFTTSDPYYYVFFIIAAIGILLHFPPREPLERAAFKGSVL